MFNLNNRYRKSNTLPNYIPVKNMEDFNYDTYCYYNQYYASPAITQQRRILRNYYNNQQSIKEFNINPFINNKNKKYYFSYINLNTYMIIEDLITKKIDTYLLNNKCWQKCNCNVNCNIRNNNY